MNTDIEIFKQTAMADSAGVIPAKPLCDFFGLDWSNQQKTFKSDPHLAQLMVKKPSTGNDGKTYQMIHFSKKGFLRWVQIINPNVVREDLKEKFLNYQLQIFDYLFGSLEEQERLQANLRRKKELEFIIKNAKDELKNIEKSVSLFIDMRFGQIQLF